MGGGMDGMGEGGTVVEMNIPGGKVGLIIGKGGDTIKQLQVSALNDCERKSFVFMLGCWPKFYRFAVVG